MKRLVIILLLSCIYSVSYSQDTIEHKDTVPIHYPIRVLGQYENYYIPPYAVGAPCGGSSMTYSGLKTSDVKPLYGLTYYEIPMPLNSDTLHYYKIADYAQQYMNITSDTISILGIAFESTGGITKSGGLLQSTFGISDSNFNFLIEAPLVSSLLYKNDTAISDMCEILFDTALQIAPGEIYYVTVFHNLTPVTDTLEVGKSALNGLYIIRQNLICKSKNLKNPILCRITDIELSKKQYVCHPETSQIADFQDMLDTVSEKTGFMFGWSWLNEGQAPAFIMLFPIGEKRDTVIGAGSTIKGEIYVTTDTVLNVTDTMICKITYAHCDTVITGDTIIYIDKIKTQDTVIKQGIQYLLCDTAYFYDTVLVAALPTVDESDYGSFVELRPNPATDKVDIYSSSDNKCYRII